MATKIRLQRHGKKRAAFYHVVIADERAKRDGKFIEKIGTWGLCSRPVETRREQNHQVPFFYNEKIALPGMFATAGPSGGAP